MSATGKAGHLSDNDCSKYCKVKCCNSQNLPQLVKVRNIENISKNNQKKRKKADISEMITSNEDFLLNEKAATIVTSSSKQVLS